MDITKHENRKPITSSKKNVFIKISLISAFLVYIGFIYNNLQLVSVSNYLLVLMVILFSLFKIINNFEYKNVIPLIAVLFIILLNFLYSINTNSSVNIRDYIYLVYLVFVIIISRYLNVTKSDLKFNLLLYFILTVLFYLELFRTGIGEQYNGALMFNFSNPNVLGSVLLTNMIFLTIGFYIINSKLYKTLIYLVIVANIYLIFLTDSRSAFILSILFILFSHFFRNRNKLTNFVLSLSVSIPLMTVIFSSLVEKIMLLDIFEFSGKENLGLNLRGDLWGTVIFKVFSKSEYFLFGADSNLLLSLSNPHNAFLYIIWWFGVPAFIVIMYLIIKQLTFKMKFKQNYISNIASWGFVVIIINNSFESHLVQGLVGGTYLAFLLLSNFVLEERSEKERTNK